MSRIARVKPYQHILILGGTGMLQGAAVELATRSRRLTSVARSETSLKALDVRVCGSTCEHSMLASDWADSDRFVGEVETALADAVAPDLMVAWLHENVLAEKLLDSWHGLGWSGDFFQVLGSAAADPTRDTVMLDARLAEVAPIQYHQVILGFVHEQSASRWLTHGEISAGVLGAIASNAPQTIVGQVRPWTLRP